MRINYWSMSSFARKLRGLFGLPKTPYAMTSEEWDDFHALEKKKNKFGLLIVDSLDRIQDIVYFIPDKLKNISYFISNFKAGSHVLRTGGKVGKWKDISQKIPDALMLSIVDFIEEECSYMWIMCSSVEELTQDLDSMKYKNQSYIRRKLFPFSLSDSTKRELGLKWIEFQINSSCNTKRGRERSPYNKLISAYNFAKDRYYVDLYEESGFSDVDMASDRKTQEGKARIAVVFEKLKALQKEYNRELVTNCTNIVRFHDYLST